MPQPVLHLVNLKKARSSHCRVDLELCGLHAHSLLPWWSNRFARATLCWYDRDPSQSVLRGALQASCGRATLVPPHEHCIGLARDRLQHGARERHQTTFCEVHRGLHQRSRGEERASRGHLEALKEHLPPLGSDKLALRPYGKIKTDLLQRGFPKTAHPLHHA